MRVAVHLQDGSVFAYKLGRIVDGQHNHNIATGEITPIDDLVDGLVKQAQKEYPDAEVVVERLHDVDGENAEWRSADEEVTPPESSENQTVELTADQNQKAKGGW